jgi:hypothetical protein
MASGPASAGRKGAATPASIMLERTVTGRTFALMGSRRMLSTGPKMMCWTLLKMRLHVLKCSDCGLEERSWRYVWKSQKVCKVSGRRQAAGNYQQSGVDGFFAQVEYELLEGHGLAVHGHEKLA